MKPSPSEVRSFYSPFAEELFFAGFKALKTGSFREVYRRNKVVIKIPLNLDGVIDNRMEARAYKLYGNKPTSLGIYLAPCRLLDNGCLMMPYVSPIKWNTQLPEWVEMVEGDQVGFYRKRLVAFDYALDLAERFVWEQESELKSDFFHNGWKHVKPFLFPPETFPEEQDVIPPNVPIGKLVYGGRV
jgi:hypothetical protein